MGKKSRKDKERAEEKRETKDLRNTAREIEMQERRQEKTTVPTTSVTPTTPIIPTMSIMPTTTEIPTTDDSSMEEVIFKRHQENITESRPNKRRMDETDSPMLMKKRDLEAR